MASTTEIKGRIDSIKETQKITNAMYLIASTKLRKARNELEQTRPYFDALRSEIKRIFRTANDVDSHYFYPPDREPELPGTYGCLVITADKGLAGAYNLNVLKKAQKLLDDHSDMKLFVVGEYGRRFFTRTKPVRTGPTGFVLGEHIELEMYAIYAPPVPAGRRSSGCGNRG